MKRPQQKPKHQPKPAVPVQRRIQQRPQGATHSPQQVLQRAVSDPRSLSHEDVLQLQRTIGNQATLKILKGGGQKSSVQTTPQPRKHEVVQRKGFWGKAFDRAFGMGAYQARRKPLYTGSVPEKSGIPLLRVQERAEYRPYMKRRAEEKRVLQQAYRKDGAEAQSVSNPYMKIDMEDILNSPLGYLAFKDYLDGEYSPEIYIFLDEATKGEKIEVEGDYRFSIKEAIYLYQTYIQVDSPFANNISNRVRKPADKTIPKLMSKRAFTGFRQAPEEVQTAIRKSLDNVLNMTRQDTYSRFIQSEHYRYAKMWAERDRKSRAFEQTKQQSWKKLLFG